ncbi:Stf0 family sulfotransferase [Planobispora takensis]|uniref:Sulphotransferase Stf0 domain-containing protein n=1 Tax=Planobispora takensis TaxID=1367882 RepID=A0A8J3SUV2_9ACTN|nr:Stf0 family sulfotransferase [Planobispora takensis]GII00051.1 hypothetical protein Pta02_20590 [Planobispora takensis]
MTAPEPVVRYIVAATPRTGSSLLCDGLFGTGVAGRPGEVFAPLFRPVWREHLGLFGHPSFEDYLRAAVRYGTTDNGVYGMKIQWMHVSALAGEAGQEGPPAGVLERLFPGSRFVNIVRRDRRAQALSWYRAGKTREWCRWAGEAPPPTSGLTLDAAAVRSIEDTIAGHQAAWERYFTAEGIEPLTVEYESLVRDYRGEIERVMTFLGLDAGRARTLPAPRLTRQADELTLRWREEMDAGERRTRPRPRSRERDGTAEARPSVIVLDNFYRHPGTVREYALRQSYYTPYEDGTEVAEGRRRATWWASGFRPADSCPFKSSAALLSVLERAVGEPVDMGHWRGDFPVDAGSRPLPEPGRERRTCLWNACFHVKPANGQRLGDGVHNHVTDGWNSVGARGWSGIVYLDPAAPLDGGLHLWRNIDPARRFDWMTPAGNWELVDSFGNLFNRMILVRGDVPHSGAGGWGDRLENGRLYQTFFFRTVARKTEWSVPMPEIGA